jgi:hypothetical protein
VPPLLPAFAWLLLLLPCPLLALLRCRLCFGPGVVRCGRLASGVPPESCARAVGSSWPPPLPPLPLVWASACGGPQLLLLLVLLELRPPRCRRRPPPTALPPAAAAAPSGELVAGSSTARKPTVKPAGGGDAGGCVELVGLVETEDELPDLVARKRRRRPPPLLPPLLLLVGSAAAPLLLLLPTPLLEALWWSRVDAPAVW